MSEQAYKAWLASKGAAGTTLRTQMADVRRMHRDLVLFGRTAQEAAVLYADVLARRKRHPEADKCWLYRGKLIRPNHVVALRYYAVFLAETGQETELDGGSAVERREMTTFAYPRDTAMRRLVRERARGRCEYCSAPGFPLSDGTLFIEAHHIEPISHGGDDTPENMIGLCSNHHREAHFGLHREKLREEFRAVVARASLKSSRPRGRRSAG